jgi:RNA polymerase sigma factor (sigma-70 family)
MGTNEPRGAGDVEHERLVRAEQLEACLPSLMAYVRRLVGDSEMARDVMQNVSVTVLTAPEAPSVDGQFAAWCRGVARNLAAYERRTRRRTQSMIPEEELEKERPDPETNPEESTNSRKVLRSLVGGLDAGEFELLVRRYVLEEDSNELASDLEQSPAALRMRLMRLRAILRDRAMRVLPLILGLLGGPVWSLGQGS